LQMAALALARPSACGAVAPDAICAGDGVGKVQVCPGDSGGPLLWMDELDLTKDVMLASTQLGIVSWGGTCQDNLPYSVFLDLSKHAPWVASAKARMLSAQTGDIGDSPCDGNNVCFEQVMVAPAAPTAPPAPPLFPGLAAPPPMLSGRTAVGNTTSSTAGSGALVPTLLGVAGAVLLTACVAFGFMRFRARPPGGGAAEQPKAMRRVVVRFI